MSDESMHSADAGMAREMESGLFVTIPRTDFARIKRQYLASQKLYVFLREVACENKHLQKRNANLERAVVRSAKQISEIVMHQNQCREMKEFSSLPSNLHDYSSNQNANVEKEIKKLMDCIEEKSEPGNRDNLSLDSDLMRDRGGQVFFPASMTIPKGQNLRDDESKILADDNSTVGVDQFSSMQHTYSVKSGVSKQYFDSIKNELAKSKQFIRQLLVKNGEQPKDIMNIIHLKEMVHSLEKSNTCLQETNHQLQSLLQSKSVDPKTFQYDKHIISLHEKVQKLQKKLELKDKALDLMNVQCDSLKNSQQEADSLQTTASVQDETEAQAVQTQIDNSASKTGVITSNLRSVMVQTNEEFTVAENKMGVSETEVISDNTDTRISELEMMLANLTVVKNGSEQRVEDLQNENKMLEKNYQQLLKTMADVERDHDAARWKEDKASLMRDLNKTRSLLKEKTTDAKYSMESVQTLQNELGKVGIEKTKLEATLKNERDNRKKQELQLLNRCQTLQAQFDRVLEEKNKLQESISGAKVRPQIQSVPRSLADQCKPMNVAWQQGRSEVSLVADGDQSMAPPMENTVAESGNVNSSNKEFKCKHCLRTDFDTLDSFESHLKKCGD